MDAWNPIFSALRTLRYAATGRIRFPRDLVGEAIPAEQGRRFVVFRHIIVLPPHGTAAASYAVAGQATFRVRFHVAGMSARQNKGFSLLPIPFFVGLPGFRSKLWMLDEASGDFQGLYRWASAQAAERYAASFAMRFMTRRSAPGSVSYEITGTDPR